MAGERTGGRRSPARPRPSVGGAAIALESSGRSPALYDYALIGDLGTAALVSRFGSIDWACFPRFDSPSTFARILDRRRGGYFQIAPRESYRSHQTYLPSTAIVRTTFLLARDRTLRLTDFLPVGPPNGAGTAPMIVRIVEASGGRIGVDAIVDARPDYARARPDWAPDGDRWLGRSRAGTVAARPGWNLRPTSAGLRGRTILEDGGRAVFELWWGAERPNRAPAAELRRATEQYWTDWAHPPDSPLHLLAGNWRPWVERSEITLKLLSRSDTGAFIAAPTTSLPEWPGGTRNWDYRYVWIRDAAFAAQSFALLGHVFEACSFLRWTVETLHRSTDPRRLNVMYGSGGETDLAEHVLPHLAGYLGSRPVRVGNAAAHQFQLDIYGELLDAARLLSEFEPETLDRSWALLERLADEVVRRWREPDRGIWELRSRPAHYVHSKVMAWVALDRAVLLGRQYGSHEPVVRWERERERIRAVVLARGFDRRREMFVQSFEERVPDAANLRIPLVGFLAPDDPRVAGTVLGVERELADGPFVHRFRPSRLVGGPEGAFLPCSFWLVECLARAGERERARRNFELLLEATSPLGLLAEEYDPDRRRPLGNYPQAFSHIALLRAALALGLATIPASVLEQHPGLVAAARRRPPRSSEPIAMGAVEPPRLRGARRRDRTGRRDLRGDRRGGRVRPSSGPTPR